jgi:TRAP-type C4-dicarboxylate transport system substrate-binding protein
MSGRPLVRLGAVAGVVAILGAAAACAAETDKAGADTIVLRFATVDGVASAAETSGSPESFARALSDVSNGRIKVDLRHNYGEGRPTAESDLVKALASGSLDGGWPATRAFASAGIDGLRAVEAPMVITSYDAQKALVSGPVGEMLLASLEGTGVKGLSLGVGPLRRPFASDAPLLGPEDWVGQTFRVFNSPVQSAAVEALGGTPEVASFSWLDKVREGSMRGAEFDVNSTLGAGLHVTSNLVLWPKVFVFSMSDKRLDALTAEQQDWVRAAAEQATLATMGATYDRQQAVDRLCSLGTQFTIANSEQIAALRARLKPVNDALAAEGSSAAVMAQLRAIAGAHPRVNTVRPSNNCRGITAPIVVPATKSGLPDGTYRVQNTIEDVEQAGLDNSGGLTGVWTLRISKGTFDLRCRVGDNPHDCGNSDFDGPLELGVLRGDGSSAYFAHRPDWMAAATGCKLPPSGTKSGHCAPEDTYVLTWTLKGDQLTFSEFQGTMPNPQYLLRPWTKVS